MFLGSLAEGSEKEDLAATRGPLPHDHSEAELSSEHLLSAQATVRTSGRMKLGPHSQESVSLVGETGVGYTHKQAQTLKHPSSSMRM